jgi:hypothetical protein
VISVARARTSIQRSPFVKRPEAHPSPSAAPSCGPPVTLSTADYRLGVRVLGGWDQLHE